MTTVAVRNTFFHLSSAFLIRSTRNQLAAAVAGSSSISQPFAL